jgi:hypothetical protein
MTSIDDDDNVGGLGAVGIEWAVVRWQNNVIVGGRGHTTGGGRRTTMMTRTTNMTMAVPRQSYTFTTERSTSSTTICLFRFSRTLIFFFRNGTYRVQIFSAPLLIYMRPSFF